MPTREQLYSALRKADAAGDEYAASRFAERIKNKEYEEVAQPVIADGDRMPMELNEFPEEREMTRAAKELPELGQQWETDDIDPAGLLAGENQSLVAAVSPALLTARNSEEAAKILQENFPNIGIQYDPGGNILATNNKTGVRNIINRPGMSQRDFLQGLGLMAAFTPAGRGLTGVSMPVLRQAAARSAATETGIQALEGVSGGEFNPAEVATSAALAPVAQVAGEKVIKPVLSGTKNVITGAFSKGKKAVQNLRRTLDDMGEERAASYLAESMKREGLSADDVLRGLDEMGEDAITADLGNSFRRYLRLAVNKMPDIEGRAGKQLAERQSGQANRVKDMFSDSAGVPVQSLDEEIIRLNKTFKPEIDRLYKEAMMGDIGEAVLKTTKSPYTGKVTQEETRSGISSSLNNLISKSPSLKKAFQVSKTSINDRKALGEQITKLDEVDAAKKVLDDQIGQAIRKGSKNKAMDLVKVKNRMINEVDNAVPQYKQARDAFAGKASLESAAEQGEMFLKMKPREVASVVQSMGESEKRMYRLGARQAIVDKLDTMNITADAINRLFKKGGSTEKLKSVFPDEKALNEFNRNMEREANFVMTRRAAQENSSTAKQMFDNEAFGQSMSGARSMIGDPMAAADFIAKITGGLIDGRKNAADVRALEILGDVLLETGMNRESLKRLLIRANPKEIEKVFRDRVNTGVMSGAIMATKPDIEGRQNAVSN